MLQQQPQFSMNKETLSNLSKVTEIIITLIIGQKDLDLHHKSIKDPNEIITITSTDIEPTKNKKTLQ